MAASAARRTISRLLSQSPRTRSINTRVLPAQLFHSRGAASKLFVGGLSFFTTEKALAEAFSEFGHVIEAKIIADKVSDRSKGFGFVTYASEIEAGNALAEMNGKILNGRVIFVETAKSRPRFDDDRPPIARGPPEDLHVEN